MKTFEKTNQVKSAAIKAFGNRTFVSNLKGNEEKIDIKNVTLAELFNSDSFSIPDFQREFSWNTKVVERFLKDFAFNLYNETDLGLITLYKNYDSELEVIDGQQRLTVITLILSASRDYTKYLLISEKDIRNISIYEEFIKKIENYLVLFQKKSGLDVPIITSRQLGSHILEKIVLGELNFDSLKNFKPEKTNSWEKKIISSFNKIYNFLKTNKIDPLRLSERILFGTTVTRSIHPSSMSTSAIISYIKINTTQEALSFENIIKAYVRLTVNKNDLLTKWTQTKQRFETQAFFDKYVFNFIKAYYPGGEKITKNNIILKFQELLESNRISMPEFVEKLNLKTDTYLTFIRKFDDEKNFKNSISFEALNLLGFDTQLPLFLLSSELENKKYYEEIVEMTKFLQVRKQTVLGLDARSVTPSLDSVVSILRNNLVDFYQTISINEDTMNEIRNVYSKNNVSDEELKFGLSKLFNSKISNNKAKGVYLFLEEERSNLSASEIKLNLKNLDIDHYFCKNSLVNGFIKIEDEDKLSKIGNRRLMLKRENRSIKDTHPFNKTIIFDKSSLNINKTSFSKETQNIDTYVNETNEKLSKHMLEALTVK